MRLPKRQAKRSQNKMEKSMVTMMAATIFTRNALRRTYQNDAEFTSKMRRLNFAHRAAVYGATLCKFMADGTIATDGIGDWLTVAQLLQENGWNKGQESDALAVILRDSWLEVLKGGYLPEELYGTATVPESCPPCDEDDA